jgi:hypothetical protein
MGSVWQHPSFGQCKRQGSTFSTTLIIPAFKKFRYDTGYSNAPRSIGKVRLTFSPFFLREKLDEPSREMVEVAEKTLAEPEKLVHQSIVARIHRPRSHHRDVVVRQLEGSERILPRRKAPVSKAVGGHSLGASAHRHRHFSTLRISVNLWPFSSSMRHSKRSTACASSPTAKESLAPATPESRK